MAQIGQTGRTMKMAFAKFGTNSWGVAASVTAGIYFESDGGLQYQPEMIDDPAFNQTFLGDSQPGLVTAPEVSLSGRTRYNDWGYAWEAMLLGSPTAGGNANISDSTSGQTTSWSHEIDLSGNTDGVGLTYAIDKNQYVEEVTSNKVVGWTFANQANGAMQSTFQVLGSKPTNISSVNINSTVGGADFPALGDRVVMQQGTFRINLAAAGGLAASDAIQAENITLEVSRPQDAPHIFGQDFIAEPADQGYPTVMLTLVRPRMNTPSANSAYAAIRSGEAFKADWTFNGAYINSADQYQMLFQFPRLQFTSDGFQASAEAVNQVKPQWKLVGKLAATSPTGMAVVNPMKLTRINANSPGAFDSLP